MTRTTTYLAALAGLALLAGCDAGSTAPLAGSPAEVRLSSAAVPAIADALLSRNGAGGNGGQQGGMGGGQIALTSLQSIDVVLDRVEVLPAEHDTTRVNEWITLKVESGATLNLLALPSAGEAGIILARGTLPAGDYAFVRLYFSEASVTFKDEVTAHGQTFAAGASYPLVIPSGRINVPTATFSVADDAATQVTLVFDEEESVKRIVARGRGTLMMPPVLGLGDAHIHR